MLSIQTVLHPTDFSERSDPAFKLACSLARDYGAKLVVLHVILPPVLIDGGDPVIADVIADFYRKMKEKLNRLQPDDPTVQVQHCLTEGDPVTEILRIAGQATATVIVMGTHGLTGAKRMLMGSVAEGVERQATCPVVIVKAPFLENPGQTHAAEQAVGSE
jgi:nucleotide-binding universal stress UspA family protein